MEQASDRALGTFAQQRLDQPHRIGIAARAGIVLGVGQDHRAPGTSGEPHGFPHSLVGLIDAAGEIRLRLGYGRRQTVGDAVGRALVLAIGQHGRAAIRHVGGREAGGEGEARHLALLAGRDLTEERGRGIDHGALPGERDEEGRPAKRLGERALAQDALEQRRRALTRHRHIDMGICPIGRERRRVFDHRRRDIGVEIEAGDDRQIRSHQTPQTPQQLALAIGQMRRDHGAMEVEINRIDGTGGGEPLQQLAGDALIGLLHDRAGRGGGAPRAAGRAHGVAAWRQR